MLFLQTAGGLCETLLGKKTLGGELRRAYVRTVGENAYDRPEIISYGRTKNARPTARYINVCVCVLRTYERERSVSLQSRCNYYHCSEGCEILRFSPTLITYYLYMCVCVCMCVHNDKGGKWGKKRIKRGRSKI